MRRTDDATARNKKTMRRTDGETFVFIRIFLAVSQSVRLIVFLPNAVAVERSINISRVKSEPFIRVGRFEDFAINFRIKTV